MLLGPDPNDPKGERGSRRVLAMSSSNLAQLAPSLLYEIRTATVRGDTGEDIVTADIAHIGESDAAGHDLLKQADCKDDSEDSALAEAEYFLLAELAEGPKLAKDVKSAAGSLGISTITLKRAKSKLAVESSKTGYRGGWEWLLPRGSSGDDPLRDEPVEPLGENPRAAGDSEGGVSEGDHGKDDDPLWTENGDSAVFKAYTDDGQEMAF